MALKFKSGDDVRQIIHPIEGKIVGKAIVDDDVQYLVEWTDKDGERCQRYFREEEIEGVANQPAQG